MKPMLILLALSSAALGLIGLSFGLITTAHSFILITVGLILLVLEIGGLALTCLIVDTIVTLLAGGNVVIFKITHLIFRRHKNPQEVK